MFFKRHIAPVVEETARTFPAVLLTGPHQVGKTTLLRRSMAGASYVTLDRLDALKAAEETPERFLETLAKPAIVDEVQYVPGLFRYVKIYADAHREKGRLLLTGSQRYELMRGVDESMAGRCGIVEMLGLSGREIDGVDFREGFLPIEDWVRGRAAAGACADTGTVWRRIFTGDLPELYAEPELSRARYYDAYIATYLERDVRGLAHVGDLMMFRAFLETLAGLSGQLLDKTALGGRLGISQPTVTRWLSVLLASNVIYLLRPYYRNAAKRLVKTPKVYFLNTGLAAHLCGFGTADELEASGRAGAFLETHVLAEIIKGHLNETGAFPQVFLYREHGGGEVDFVIEKNGVLYPVEVKRAERAVVADTRWFKGLDGFDGVRRGPGAVVCTAHEPLPVGERDWMLPVGML